jgi:O-succinylbenzoic acid--CoA ligase
VHGRADDLIVTGGENVWPTPVEERIRTHPGVTDVAVVGQPDPEWGQRVVAVIVPAPGFEHVGLDDIRIHVREVLPAPAAPREVRLVDELPRTSLGKVRRGRVAAELSEGG